MAVPRNKKMEQKKIMLLLVIILWLLVVGFGVTFLLGAAKVSDNKFPKDKGYGIENDNLRKFTMADRRARRGNVNS
jgi:flagellar basal body-associated protein FliL